MWIVDAIYFLLLSIAVVTCWLAFTDRRRSFLERYQVRQMFGQWGVIDCDSNRVELANVSKSEAEKHADWMNERLGND